MQAAHQVVSSSIASFASRCASSITGGRLRRQVGEGGPGQAEVHGEGDQPLLGAVVQVALDPPPFGVGGVEHAGPALGEVLDPARQLSDRLGRAGPGRQGFQPYEPRGQTAAPRRAPPAPAR